MAATRITVMNNGSLRVEGEFEIADQDGRIFDVAGRTRVSLCRCGQSNDKPFCDSSHKTCGFDSVVVARALPPPAPKPAPAPNAVPPPKPGS
jgi:CDGSH-type Zn-finger protein